MSATGRSGAVRRSHGDDLELNLTPIIDCFITLICFLLLSATYVNLVTLDGKVPVAVRASEAKEPAKPAFHLELAAKAGGLELAATGAGAASGRRWIAKKNGAHDLAVLGTELGKIKKEKPTEATINFSGEGELTYAELVAIMDASRNGAEGGEKVAGACVSSDGRCPGANSAGRDNAVVTGSLLFPDFVFAGLGATKK